MAEQSEQEAVETAGGQAERPRAEDVILYYRADLNPRGASVDGVPQADLTRAIWFALAPGEQAAAQGSPIYSAEAPPAAPAEAESEAQADTATADSVATDQAASDGAATATADGETPGEAAEEQAPSRRRSNR